MIEAKDVEDWKIFIKSICWWSTFCLDYHSGCRKCLSNKMMTIQSPMSTEDQTTLRTETK